MSDGNERRENFGVQAPKGLVGRRWWLAFTLVLVVALMATVPTVGDLGLTWDEPAYRFSQFRASQWWERLARARTSADVVALLDPDALLFYWPYARHGINFHPPLAGQLNLLTYQVFGRWMQDIPARRMASVLEFSLTIALGFGFLARRYGIGVGGVMALGLLTMPRVYGDAHLATTDMPGLLLWAATALAFWKGLHEPGARSWRVLVGVLLGLGFVEKMGAVFVLGPLLIWLVATRLPRAGRLDWIDGALTSTLMLAPLGLALAEILRLAAQLPQPKFTDLYVDRPPSAIPGAILAAPLAVWIVRRLLGRTFRAQPLWGAERPGLETATAILAFAPVVAWLGNPAWWRETLPRLAHYYLLNTDRRGSLPDIRIYYLGQTYLFSLPWHNAWVLIAVTVPATVLLASVVGMVGAIRNARRDPLPLYFVLQMVTLPIVRMFATPAHDGVRLLLPTFFFLAALAGLGTLRLADRLARGRPPGRLRAIVAAVVLIPSAWQLVKVHPFELSYYNELIGGPRGAWRSGLFELTYWYDAFTPRAIDDLNRLLPPHAELDFCNNLTQVTTFYELQTLGHLRADLVLGWVDIERLPFVWLLTQDSKAWSFTRLLYAMTPWYAVAPRQLDGLRVATVADPRAVARAGTLWLLTESYPDHARPRPRAPGWVHALAPRLGRFWGEGQEQPPRPDVFEPIFEWASTDPDDLLTAARFLATHPEGEGETPSARRLRAILDRPHSNPSLHAAFRNAIVHDRPEALVEAVQILIAHPDAVRKVLTHEGYTDTNAIGGPLDRDLTTSPESDHEGSPASVTGNAPRSHRSRSPDH